MSEANSFEFGLNGPQYGLPGEGFINQFTEYYPVDNFEYQENDNSAGNVEEDPPAANNINDAEGGVDEGEDLQDGHTNGKTRASCAGRKLMRWNAHVDQLVLLWLDYHCVRAGITLPWNEVAQSIQPWLSGEAIKQHNVKMRAARIMNSMPVPPKIEKGERRAIKMELKAAEEAKKNGRVLSNSSGLGPQPNVEDDLDYEEEELNTNNPTEQQKKQAASLVFIPNTKAKKVGVKSAPKVNTQLAGNKGKSKITAHSKPSNAVPSSKRPRELEKQTQIQGIDNDYNNTSPPKKVALGDQTVNNAHIAKFNNSKPGLWRSSTQSEFQRPVVPPYGTSAPQALMRAQPQSNKYLSGFSHGYKPAAKMGVRPQAINGRHLMQNVQATTSAKQMGMPAMNATNAYALQNHYPAALPSPMPYPVSNPHYAFDGSVEHTQSVASPAGASFAEQPGPEYAPAEPRYTPGPAGIPQTDALQFLFPKEHAGLYGNGMSAANPAASQSNQYAMNGTIDQVRQPSPIFAPDVPVQSTEVPDNGIPNQVQAPVNVGVGTSHPALDNSSSKPEVDSTANGNQDVYSDAFKIHGRNVSFFDLFNDQQPQVPNTLPDFDWDDLFDPSIPPLPTYNSPNQEVIDHPEFVDLTGFDDEE